MAMSGLMLDPVQHIRFRQRLLQLRARMSIPALLAGYDEKKIVAIVTAVNGSLAILTLIAIAWFVDLPLLFPALGPSAFLLFSEPFSRSAAPRSVILGHSIGISVGYASWQLVSALNGQVVSLEQGGWPILLSASLAMAACSILLIYLSCPHPPSCASALIVAMGAASTGVALLGMAAGVLLLTLQATVINRLVGLKSPVWSPREDDIPIQ